MRLAGALAVGVILLMAFGTCAPAFADGANIVAPPRVSYNPGAASVYHAPISSMGLVALTKSYIAGSTTPSSQNSQGSSATPQSIPAGLTWFINDSSYAPQSETSVAVNPSNTNEVVGGYNDGRYFFCPTLDSFECPNGYTESVTGFTTSTDGGATVAKSNDLPGVSVTEQNLTSGGSVPGFLVSWGDPSLAAAPDGTFYFGSLAIDQVTGVSGIMLSKSNSNLWNPSVDCSTPLNAPDSNPCWTSSLVFGNMSFQCGVGGCAQSSFEDKDTIAVDNDPSSAYYGYAYVAWDHFFADGTSSTYVAVCSPSLSCSMLAGGGKPVASGTDLFAAFSTPSVDASGNVYITWCDFGTLTDFGPVYCNIRSSAAGGASFGPVHQIMSFMGGGTELAADTVLIGYATEQFRVASVPTVAAGAPGDVYFAIPVCVSGFYYRFNNLPTLPPDNPGDCGESAVYFVKSTNGGATWSTPAQVSPLGVEVQPTLSVDPMTGAVVLAYYTSQFDPFEHRLDVGVQVSTDGGNTFSFIRATSVSNEPNADPSAYDYLSPGGFGGSMVVPQYGDYFTATALNGRVWILFAGNYAQVQGTYKVSPFLAVVGETRTSLNLSSNARDAAPGDQIAYDAGGFAAGSNLSLSLAWNGASISLANATVAADGTARGNFTVPNVQSQLYTVTATDGADFSSAQLGVGQVSLAPVQSSLASLQSLLGTDFSSLRDSVTSGFASVSTDVGNVGAAVSSSSNSLQAGIAGLGSNLGKSQSTSDTVEYLTAAIFVLLVVLLAMQLMMRRKAKTPGPAAEGAHPTASETPSVPSA